MIDSLRIENFAIIETALINFNSGFTVVTGETGSGKSILLNALSLILGERANFTVIGNKGDKSTVEAELLIKGFELESFFKAHELDYFDRTIVRREILKQGRSRAFINDTPVQLSVLKAFSGQLIHIHSQYNTLELKSADFQLKIVDVLAGTLSDRAEFYERKVMFSEGKKQLLRLKKEFTEVLSQADYNQFQLNELEELNLPLNNFDQIQEALNQAENADDIRVGFGAVVDSFQSEEGINDKLSALKVIVSRKAEFDKNLNDILERINTILIESKDLTSEAEDHLAQVDVDPRRIEELTDLLNRYNRALQKHNKTSQAELVALYDELSESSFQCTQLENDITRLDQELKLTETELLKLANVLHEKRKQAIPGIEAELTRELVDLKLENTILRFDLNQEAEFNAYGNSHLEILFSPNVGVDPVAIHQAASGGELSRVMLALQSVMSSKVKLRTMLFDEIDTGVSGDVAQKMGSMLKKMGGDMQVIAITHLPQVAAKGGQHLKVIKDIEEGETKTIVQELTGDERIEETARLMSGDEINVSALDNARALMK
ncbi:MAG: DNA repair protein RecN [Crocinitomicaceae bacterium]|nr:DNA repair protein RecN [Crocinitomicaceae bacterium]MDG1777355.1 DNA repair protein RecN [Crocinitomicaceae bacterium]